MQSEKNERRSITDETVSPLQHSIFTLVNRLKWCELFDVHCDPFTSYKNLKCIVRPSSVRFGKFILWLSNFKLFWGLWCEQPQALLFIHQTNFRTWMLIKLFIRVSKLPLEVVSKWPHNLTRPIACWMLSLNWEAEMLIATIFWGFIAQSAKTIQCAFRHC